MIDELFLLRSHFETRKRDIRVLTEKVLGFFECSKEILFSLERIKLNPDFPYLMFQFH